MVSLDSASAIVFQQPFHRYRRGMITQTMQTLEYSLWHHLMMGN